MEKFRIVFKSGEWKIFIAEDHAEARAKAIVWAYEQHKDLPFATKAQRDYRYNSMTIAWCHNVKELKRGQAGYSA